MPDVPQPHELATARRGIPWFALALLPVAVSASWILYSRFAVNHRAALPPSLPGERFDLQTAAGRVSLCGDAASTGTPLLLIHSVNAAASGYEVRPLFDHYRSHRPVYALDLPGFGFSERSDRVYTPRTMVDALIAATEAIAGRHGGGPIDIVALSLSAEYIARAALERPDLYRSLGMISPTGFDRRLSGKGRAQTTKGSPSRLAIVSVPLWSEALFDLVVTRPSIRFFLEKTWGSKNIDEGLLEYDSATAHQPGARHAVWSFLSGFLFADDISRIYEALRLPIWAVNGTRGDFVDYRREKDVAGKSNWTFDQFDTGAFPHFERLDEVAASYDRFAAALE